MPTNKLQPSLNDIGDQVFVAFEMTSPQDDYRAYSYITRVIECLGNANPLNVCVLGGYRGPLLKHPGVRLRTRKTSARAPHTNGLSRLGRAIVKQLRQQVNLHWFADLSGDQHDALSWIQSWGNRDNKAILFAHNLASGLKLIELIYLFAPVVPQGIVLVLLEESPRQDPEKEQLLKTWGVNVIGDGSIYNDTNLLSAKRRRLNFHSPVELPLQARQSRLIDWKDELAVSELRVRYPESVLFVRPDWMKCGSATTFAKLTNLLRRRGAIVIDVALQPYRERYDTKTVTMKLTAIAEDIKPSLHFNFRRAILPIALGKIGLNYIRQRPRSIAGFMPIFYQQCSTPHKAFDLLRKARINYLYVNHYFTLPYIKAQFPQKPIFLDTHDIQSLNFVSHDYHKGIGMRASPFSRCFADELKVINIANRVTMVSEDEIDLARQQRPDKNYFFYIPLPNSSHSPGSDSRVPMYSQAEDKVVRLLIVASRNPSNERSLRWFFNNIWPFIATENVQLDVVGGVVHSFPSHSYPKVNFLGIIDNLDEAYTKADIILLPITNGGGIAIKTLEAIQWGKAISATRHAMRGLPKELKQLIPSNSEEQEIIDDLRQMISDPESRRIRATEVCHIQRELARRDFDGQMQKELDTMWHLSVQGPGQRKQLIESQPLMAKAERLISRTDDPELATKIERQFQLSLQPSNRALLEDLNLTNTIRPDSDPSWVEAMLAREAVHDEDYQILRIFDDPETVILDIGANWGYSVGSIWCSGALAKIISFEANPAHKACLEKIKSLRRQQYDYVITALSNYSGQIDFVAPVINNMVVTALATAADDVNPISLARATHQHLVKWRQELFQLEIYLVHFQASVTTLDKLLTSQAQLCGNRPIVAIKIDVEGLEFQVMQGSEQIIRSWTPLILTESPSQENGMGQWLASLGYSYAERQGNQLVMTADITANNGFFVHESRLSFYRDRGVL
jgi:FkbM family methyltransferase